MAIYKNENGTMVKYAGGGGSAGSSGASVVISETEPTDQNVGDLWLVIDGDDGTVDDETVGAYEEAGLYDDDGIMLMSWDDLVAGVNEESYWDVTADMAGYDNLAKYCATNNLSGSLIIPDTIQIIGDFAFYNCSSIYEIKIPDSVTSIGWYAFQSCGIKNIVIPDSVTEIGSYSFNECVELTDITLPNGITNIPEHLVDGCEKLKNITIPESVTVIDNYGLCNCGLTNFSVPSTITTIGDFAFENCSLLETITIPENVTFINSYFLMGTSSLREIFYNSSMDFPGILLGCGENADTTCYFGENLSTLPCVFYSKGSSGVAGEDCFINHIVIKGNVTTIPRGWLEASSIDNWELKSVFISSPENIETIKERAFGNQSYLAEFIFPPRLTTIGDQAFYNCTSISDLIIPDTVTTIDTYSFYNVPHITYHGTATGAPWGALSIN